MNDVLAKPFTRDGMVRILRKHLTRMLKDPQGAAGLVVGDEMGGQAVAGHGPGPPPNQAGYPASMAAAGLGPLAGTTGAVKFEHTPIQSPSTASSWHSPGQIHQPQTSPSLDTTGGGGGYLSAGPGGMVLTPGGGTQRPGAPPPPPPPQQQQQQQQAGYGGYMTAGMVAGLPPGAGGGGGPDERPEKRQRLYGPVSGGQGYV